MTDEPKFKHGQIVTIEGTEFEVLHVSLNDDENHPLNFHYELVLKTEADALHEQNRQDAKNQETWAIERSALEKEAAEIGVTEITEARFPDNDSLRKAIELLKEHKARQAEEQTVPVEG